uniref:Uncharacterized protein n=1 Tax=Cygnus columbianus parvoviridae sp. TaxID=2794474 RepID=A0A8A4XE92_9VIRU|nr:MAG: hypothetical protein [Cygnus columbianus parvoviridae sp.]
MERKGVLAGRVGKVKGVPMGRFPKTIDSDTVSVTSSTHKEEGASSIDVAEMEDRTHELSEMEQGRTEMMGSRGASKLSMPRPVGFANIDLIFNARMFFTMYVFDPCFGLSEQVGSGTTGVIVFPNYVFNTGNLSMYLDPTARDKIVGIMGANLNVQVKNISGSLKSVGVSAPFVAGGTDQAATNSQITATGLVGHGLERVTELIEGRITISNETTTPTNFRASPTTTTWWANTQKVLNTTPNAINVLNGDKLIPTAQYVEYLNVAGQICPKNGSENQIVADVNYTKQMASIDLTESQGEILAWDYDMHDSFLATKSISDLSKSIQFNTAPDVKYARNGEGAGLITSTFPNFFQLSQFQNHLNDASISAFYITNNNADPVGVAGARHQTLPPKAYLQLVPPPTINPNTIQDFFLNTVLDTTIVISAFGSSVANDNFTHEYVYVPKTTFTGFRNSCLDGGHYVPISGNGIIEIGSE